METTHLEKIVDERFQKEQYMHGVIIVPEKLCDIKQTQSITQKYIQQGWYVLQVEDPILGKYHLFSKHPLQMI